MTTTEIIIKLEALKGAADAAIIDLENAASYLDIADPLSASEKRAVLDNLDEATHHLIAAPSLPSPHGVAVSILRLSLEVQNMPTEEEVE